MAVSLAWLVSDSIKAVLSLAELLFGAKKVWLLRRGNKHGYRISCLCIVTALMIFLHSLTAHEPLAVHWRLHATLVTLMIVILLEVLLYLSLLVSNAAFATAIKQKPQNYGANTIYSGMAIVAVMISVEFIGLMVTRQSAWEAIRNIAISGTVCLSGCYVVLSMRKISRLLESNMSQQKALENRVFNKKTTTTTTTQQLGNKNKQSSHAPSSSCQNTAASGQPRRPSSHDFKKTLSGTMDSSGNLEPLPIAKVTVEKQEGRGSVAVTLSPQADGTFLGSMHEKGRGTEVVHFNSPRTPGIFGNMNRSAAVERTPSHFQGRKRSASAHHSKAILTKLRRLQALGLVLIPVISGVFGFLAWRSISASGRQDEEFNHERENYVLFVDVSLYIGILTNGYALWYVAGN